MNAKLDLPAIGQRIREQRIAAEMTQAALTALVGGSGSKVSEWENGQRLPETGALYAMAQRFGVTVDYLLTGQHRAPDFVAAGLRDLLDQLEPVAPVAPEVPQPTTGRNPRHTPAKLTPETATPASKKKAGGGRS